MSRPALVKLGGSLLTGKADGAGFQKPAARRLLGEIRRAEMPTVVVHGAGSQGHPEALRYHIGQQRVGRAGAEGVAQTLAAVGALHAQVVAVAAACGLRPLSIGLDGVQSEAGELQDLPTARVRSGLADGFTPMLHGTLVRDDELGWRILGGDELMAELARELSPRVVLFATDVDGIFDGDPGAPGARPLARVGSADLPRLQPPTDATGGMAGKLGCALAAARAAPTLIVNGGVRSRLLDALKGKAVTGTRIET
ncbi:MAG: isopentenyl phosphate kinase [Thermoplasmatota archaeon]